MSDIDKAEFLFDKINNIVKNHDKKLYSKNIFVYYSPFEANEFDLFNNYSLHVLCLIENTNYIEQAAIGNFIEPKTPYTLVENDIIVEFRNNKVSIFRTEVVDKTIKLVCKANQCEDNYFILKYLGCLLKNTG